MISIFLIIIGLVLLVKCADIFVDGCSNVAMAFGTSAPEAAVSITASIKGMNDISLGNVVGSNLCNLLLVLGISSLGGCLTARRKIITRDFVYAIFSSIVMVILSFSYFIGGGKSGVIDRTDGLILLCFLGIYLYALLGDAIRSVKVKEEKTEFNLKDFFNIIIGIVGIILGGQLVVNSATNIAEMLKVSQNVIALTIVAIGTSLPELVTSAVAARKGESDIAIGNVVGSNIFNIFFILGISSVISPISYGFNSFVDIVIMLFASIMVYFLTLKNFRIGNKKGLILLGTYAIYMIYILIR